LQSTSVRTVEGKLKPVECPLQVKEPTWSEVLQGDGMLLNDRAARRSIPSLGVPRKFRNSSCDTPSSIPEILEKALERPQMKEGLARMIGFGGE